MGTFDRRRGQDDRDPGHTRLKRLTMVLSVLAVTVTAAVLAVVISVDASRRRPAPSPRPDTASPTPEALSALGRSFDLVPTKGAGSPLRRIM
ncbi:hypothetical protein Psi02_33650 [Planotetraspora silvatica]|uniref:Uncharacterized protein n=1 Tax=Planotetraspora silvatica TaxID=234614 RepID=A0A8J3XP20_9ACTN|nr:hypothetical protein [Planotetraspora silvatica]GII46941.1 hypothetical protein Psi02_33650 [Planotetraspora silvatica]